MTDVTHPSWGAELRKLAAFPRRDLLAALSYRTAFVSDAVGMVVQAVVLAFIARLIDPDVLPSYGGQSAGYLEFVVTGLTVGGLVSLGMGKLTSVVRSEQLMGTLESLYATPTSTITIQLGSVIYDLVYVPLRTGFLLAFATAVLGVTLSWSSLIPALVVLLAMLPATWGVGLVAGAMVLTFRRGFGIGLVATVLGIASGVYIPLDLLPTWLQRLGEVNPIAIALEAVRTALLGGADWSQIVAFVPRLLIISGVSLAIGTATFAWALRRERRMGTLGQY
jgi:ABC-2 type transport system permease protein